MTHPDDLDVIEAALEAAALTGRPALNDMAREALSAVARLRERVIPVACTETLEALRKQLNHERNEFNRLAMASANKRSKEFMAGWFDANSNAKMQISYALAKITKGNGGI